MRKQFPLKALSALFSFLITCSNLFAQKPPTIKVDPIRHTIPVKLDPSLISIRNLQDCYILERRFWANDVRTQKVVTDDGYANDNRYKWRPVQNSDGSYYLISLANPSARLVYERWNRDIPARIPGMTEGNNLQDGYYVRVPPSGGFTSSPSASLTDKWWLKNIEGFEYWLLHTDRRDSVRIRMLPVTWMPLTPFSYNFNDLSGWILGEGGDGQAFKGQPSRVTHIPYYDSPVIPPMPLGGSYWRDLEWDYHSLNTNATGGYINSARPWSDAWRRPDESAKGTMISPPFLVCYGKMSFKIAGTEDAANIRFEILEEVATSEPGAITFPDGYYKPFHSSTGHNNDIARMVVVDLRDRLHKRCRFRMTDQSLNGHLIVDDIDRNYTGSLGSSPRPPDPVFPSTQKPVFGAIDMHTHPMSYMGMGGKLMHGKLDGDPAVSLGNCNCTHGGWGADNSCGNYLRAEIVNLIDEHDENNQVRYLVQDLQVPHKDHRHIGYPILPTWPSQTSMTHQQMWYDWIRRARMGGLSAIVALTVNSEVLARVLGGDAPYDDKTTADRQIDSLIAFVHRHRDFLDTVTSPARMRQVINEGKMAVIIGMEIDNIGNFYQNVPVTNEQIRYEITRLKNKGVRYMFPIHVTDNKFGGSAVYKTLFSYGNKYVTGQPITGGPPELYPPALPGNLFRVETAPDRNVSFRLEGGLWSKLRSLRPLLELIDAGGFPVLPPPADVPSLALKPIVDPILQGLKYSSQYQLAKKLFLDQHPELNTYEHIERTPTDRGGHRNVLGLSPEGEFAVREMMRQGIMIDVDHASEKSVSDILRIAMENDYPVNSGHNGLRGRNANEKERTLGQLDTIRQVGGMMGIGWEEQNPQQFSTIYRNHLNVMGYRNTTFGSDIDGYASTPRAPGNRADSVNYNPSSGASYLIPYSMPGSPRVWNYNREGMAHYGMVPDFFQAAIAAGMRKSDMNQLLLSSEYFAQMWDKCQRRAPAVRR